MDIIDPSYSNNYFYGASELGLPVTPSGINIAEITLRQSEKGQYIVLDELLNVDATELIKLNFSSSVGANF